MTKAGFRILEQQLKTGFANVETTLAHIETTIATLCCAASASSSAAWLLRLQYC